MSVLTSIFKRPSLNNQHEVWKDDNFCAYYCHGGENSTLNKVLNPFLQAKPGTNGKYIQSMKISECPDSFH